MFSAGGARGLLVSARTSAGHELEQRYGLRAETRLETRAFGVALARGARVRFFTAGAGSATSS
jgi:hypothetical protein